MNENPGGTPNPLNPNVGPVPTPEPLSANPAEPISPTPTVEAEPMPTAPATELTPATSVASDEKPTENPVGSVVEPKPKKKTGLIIGIVVLVLALIGGGVAAMFAMGLFNGGDPVAKAISKMMSGSQPEYVSVNGTVTVTPDDTSVFSQIKIDLKTSAQASSMINSTTANLTATTATGDLEVSLGEVYAANGDLYINISGVSEAIEALSNPVVFNNEETPEGFEQGELPELSELPELPEGEMPDETFMPMENCDQGENCVEPSAEFGEMLTGIIGSILGAVDGEWIRIPTTSLSEVSTSFGVDASTQCLISAASQTAKNENSIAEIYNKNAFISGSNENISVTKKNDPIYKLVFDDEKLTNFFTAIDEANLYGDSNCLGTSGSISAEEMVQGVKSLPTIYVEVNGEDQFTRIYMNGSSEGSTYTIDLSIAYPTNINVSEPEEYVDFEDVLTGIFMSMFDYDANTIDFSEEL